MTDPAQPLPEWTRTADAAELPGFRRVLRVDPAPGMVTAMLEDDIHAMGVRLHHDGGIVTRVEPLTERMPWTTCPGAAARLVETFEGRPLAGVTARVDKTANCTHLHDLSVIGAAHAEDDEPFEYRYYASDPVDGIRILEIRRDGTSIHRWTERDGTLAAPAQIAGLSLRTMREWIGSLAGTEQEASRLLQWGAMVAYGRTMKESDQNRAADMPPSCYTFQPEQAAHAHRSGARFDFSGDARVPLSGMRATWDV